MARRSNIPSLLDDPDNSLDEGIAGGLKLSLAGIYNLRVVLFSRKDCQATGKRSSPTDNSELRYLLEGNRNAVGFE